MNIEKAFFILRTCDLDSNNNTRGFSNDGKTSFTWNNINLRLILGSMYDKYDRFNLSLKTMASAVATSTISSDPSDLNVLLYCSVLPFLNQTYDVVNGTTQNTVLESFQFYGALKTPIVFDQKQYFDNRCVTFEKSQESLNLNIFYKSVSNNIEPQTDIGLFPDVVFLFEITGIPNEVGNKNGTRLF